MSNQIARKIQYIAAMPCIMYILLFSCSLIPHFVGFSLFETRKNRDLELVSARALCFVVGLFFIAVFFYWIFLLIWEFHWKNPSF